MKDFAQILKSLGLNDSELKTYLAALKHGASTVVELTKHTHLSRQAIYLAIESMTERGLMSSLLHGKKRLFTAEPPTKLLAYAKRKQTEMHERISDLEHSLPELELQIGGERPMVRMYEGKEAIRAYLADVQKDKPKEVYEIADLDALDLVLSKEDLDPVRGEIKRSNTKIVAFYSRKSGYDGNGLHIHGMKTEHGGFKSNVTIYGDKIALVTLAGKVFSVIIEDKHIAEGLRALFALAQEGVKK